MPQVSGAINATVIARGDFFACSRTSRYSTPAIFTLSIEPTIGDLREGLEKTALARSGSAARVASRRPAAKKIDGSPRLGPHGRCLRHRLLRLLNRPGPPRGTGRLGRLLALCLLPGH